MKVELDFDASYFAKRFDLASLKSDADKLGTDKLEKVPHDLKSWKSKANKLDIVTLETTLLDFSKVSDEVKQCCYKD